MKNLFWGILHLAKKYLVVIHRAWSIRGELAPTIKEKQDYEFLPAHLEIIETPVSPIPRYIASFIMLFLGVALLISTLCQVEIVAVSPGQLALNGRSKIIQPIETSKVNKVYVKDGEVVKRGQLLISLSAIGAESELAKNESSLTQAKLEEQRLQYLLEAIEHNELPDLNLIYDSKLSNLYELERSAKLLEEQFVTWKIAREQQKTTIQQRVAEKEAINAQVVKLKNKKELVFTKLLDIRKLFSKNAISKHALLDQEDRYVEVNNELTVQMNYLNQAEAAIKHAEEEYQLLFQTFHRDTLSKLNQAKETIDILYHELMKSKERQESLNIRSPVDGIVQELATFTEGGVVTTAQSLMVIVPDGERLDVKAMISNKDIGFVHAGQPVIVKVEAFPYTRYGYLYGTVNNVSTEAINDKDKGIYFDCEIILNKSSITIDNKDVFLSSGMSVSAEIITGHRRVIDFLLSPLRETIDKSFKER
ncbi:HlyD family type I secretion periplasmic adaptor subunit [Citrobacter werkmanii]|uniref:HlyD family type I secretion periplasmic adaptor subunit n=1 Tax=Citrobacter werkmanii TaxID=67827 RepID=UPI00126A9DF3|nr:HlyD family type I secretion periplasmic adaptor subunit [Salmonella enterica]EBN2521030.1 HlyD family type I secretion periplasmic adaptor subunit [Salmonella enterica]